MRLVIVPDDLRDAINEKLDAAYVAVPDAAINREIHYSKLLEYFDEHGFVPEFQLAKSEAF